MILHLPKIMPSDSPGFFRNCTVAVKEFCIKISCELSPECLPESSENVGDLDLNSATKFQYYRDDLTRR